MPGPLATGSSVGNFGCQIDPNLRPTDANPQIL